MRKSMLVFALLAATAALPVAAADTYTLDPNHTQIRFGWNHFGFSNMEAGFDSFSGELKLDTTDWTQSSVDITIPLDSVDSGVADFDTHLKSGDFFDTAKGNDATFKSTKVEKAGDNKLTVTGNLTLHGITKEVVLDVTVNKVGKHPMSGAEMAGFDATAKLKRSDFKVDKYVPNVSDEVWIKISAEAKKAG